MSIDKAAASETMKRRGWLSRQPAGFQATVLARSSLSSVAAKCDVYVSGDPVGGIYGLVAGTVGVSITPGCTGPHLAHLATPGWWFGEGCFLTGQPRRIGVEAVTDCTLFSLPLPEMNRLAAEDTESIRRFAQIAMFNIDLALLAIEDLLQPDPARRVAGVLWRGAGGQSNYRLPITQTALGQIANTSRKETRAALSALGDLGAIRQHYGAIEVRDEELLRRFADASRLTE